MNKGLYSSISNEWETPKNLYEELNKEFHFTLDPCATKENAKCKKYYTLKDNGLILSWNGETVFMNPPYGREIGKWIEKAYNESKEGVTVVCLIPARTDTSYWHDFILGKAEMRFLRGRLKFRNGDNCGYAPFPSAIVIFKGDT